MADPEQREAVSLTELVKGRCAITIIWDPDGGQLDAYSTGDIDAFDRPAAEILAVLEAVAESLQPLPPAALTDAEVLERIKTGRIAPLVVGKEPFDA